MDYYSVYRLRQFSEPMAHVYLLCFIQHRYQKLHDNLIQSMIHHVRRHGDDAKEAAKEMVYNVRVATNGDMPMGGQILKMFTDGSIAGTMPFEEVRRKAFLVLTAPRLDALAEYLTTTAQFDEKAFQWEHIDKAAQRIKINLRPILQGVEFAATAADDPLIEAVQFLKEASRSGKALGAYKEQDIPLRWVPEKMKRYLYEKDGTASGCLRIATSSFYTASCATAWRQAISSAATASGSAASKMISSTTSSGGTRTADCRGRTGYPPAAYREASGGAERTA